MKKRFLAFALACIMMFALAACGSSTNTNSSNASNTSAPTSQTPATDATAQGSSQGEQTEVKELNEAGEKVINVAMTLNMGDMDAFAASSQSRNAMRYSTYEYLAVFTEFGQTYEEMEKQIAKEITKIDDVTYEVEIYDYVVDAAGRKVTAEDVAWSWNTLDESAMYNRVTSTLEAAEALDDTHVRITLSSPIVGGIEYLLAQCNIVNRESYEANEGKNSLTPITTAAYQITECVSGSYYIMEKNPNYWQKEELRGTYNQQQVDKFNIQIITEAQQVATALQSGTVDLVTSVSTSNMDYFMDPSTHNAVDGYSINEYMETTGIMLGFNMKEGSVLADNLALRQAIAYGVDSDAMVNGAMNGHAIKLVDVAIPGCSDSNPDWANEDYYDYNPEKAAELLAEAGYPNGGGLHLVLMCESSREKVALVAQATLMQLGLDIEVKAVDDAMMSAYQTDPTQWDLMISKCGADFTCLGPYNTELAKDKNGWARRSFFVDDVFQQMLADGQTVSGNTQEAVNEIHNYVKDNCYKIGLYTALSVSAGKAGIEIINHPWGPLVWTACDYSAYFGE